MLKLYNTMELGIVDAILTAGLNGLIFTFMYIFFKMMTNRSEKEFLLISKFVEHVSVDIKSYMLTVSTNLISAQQEREAIVRDMIRFEKSIIGQGDEISKDIESISEKMKELSLNMHNILLDLNVKPVKKEA